MNKMKLTRRQLLGATALLPLAGCGGSSGDHDNELGRELQQAIEGARTRYKWIPSIQVAVRSGPLDLEWSGATGYAVPSEKIEAQPETPFRIASTTKTFTAAAMYRLQELGRLRMTDSVAEHASSTSLELLRRYGYDAGAITLEQMAAHTSGLPDYGTSSAYFESILANPTRHWMRHEQIEFALQNLPSPGGPGTTYMYSDTGYVILGEIIEMKTGRATLGDAYNDLLGLRSLGLRSTWQEKLEQPPQGTRRVAHAFFQDDDASTIDASHDLYGGGGLISTAADLVKFMVAWGTDRMLRPDSRVAMQTVFKDSDGARGIGRTRFAGDEAWGHGGFWGSLTCFFPRSRTAMAVMTNITPVSQYVIESQYTSSVLFEELYAIVRSYERR